MYTATQYICAAIHDYKINPRKILDRLEDKHKAPSVEIGLDLEEIYLAAQKAASRKTLVNAILLLPLLYVSWAIIAKELLLLLQTIPWITFPIVLVLYLEKLQSNIDVLKCVEKPGRATQIQQNIVVSGGGSPFSGYGNELNGWSFVVDLQRSLDFSGQAPSPVTSNGLLEAIRVNMQGAFNGIRSFENFFIHGCDVRKVPAILPTPTVKPITNINNNDHPLNADINGSVIRKYLGLELPVFNDQLRLTIFLRMSIIKNKLYIESRYFLLLPISGTYRGLDNAFVRVGVFYHIRSIFSAAARVGFSWLRVLVQLSEWGALLFDKVVEHVIGDRENWRKLRSFSYNYGHESSLREEYSAEKLSRYFEEVDKDQGYKTMQMVAINSIVDYLEQHGVSTEEIKQKQTTILNSGVIVNGGVRGTSVAIGANSKIINRFLRKLGRE